MTPEEQAEVRQIVLNVLTEIGASVENTDEVPIVDDVTSLNTSTTMPLIGRTGTGEGTATGYVQIKISDLATLVASLIDPEEAFPTKMEAVTEDEFNAIFYPSDDSSDDSSE